ncbi:MAG: tRNA uridine-5-carboxymethylaminomethyl(34) synthesis GTPase MnmE [Bacteroidaceae bacterium]|nr:tRNA uridine-5-carboxymethylaminomethyl(34) synthesis GTPase MnmE [Bacteroidaceae bacterium]
MNSICAIATAAGGAIGIVRLSGTNAIEIADSVFNAVNHKSLAESQPNSVHLGQIVAQGELIDEALVTVFRAPHSYTGEDSVEFSCHGSRYVLQHVVEALIEAGAQQAAPGEFTQRAFLNGKLDLSQAEAVADLIAADSRATHRVAMSQLRGQFSNELSHLREQLLRLTSLLELELDFSDHEELEFADRTELLQLADTIRQRVSTLAASFRTGQALKKGIPVAIVGAPNVGKSTLLNALVGEERAIVSDIQGTTRDTIEDTIQLGGITFRFIDTAGIRHTTDQIESLGIERSLAAVSKAQVILLVTEPGVPYPVLNDLRPDQTVIRIENKTASFQAKFGIGLEELKQQLIAVVPAHSDTDIIVTSTRHYEALLRAYEALQRVIDGLTSGLSGDLIAEDLRLTLSHLADITGGIITPQETLNTIFSEFCIGK